MVLFSSEIKKFFRKNIIYWKRNLVFSILLLSIVGSISAFCLADDNGDSMNDLFDDDADLGVSSQVDDSSCYRYSNLTYNYHSNSIKFTEDNKVLDILKTNTLDITDSASKVVEESVESLFDSSSFFDDSIDNITVDNMDSFSIDDKIKFICNKYNLTEFEFKVVASVVYHETYDDNYDDAYRVINTIYNRTISKEYVRYISYLTGLDGRSLYAQVIACSHSQDGKCYKQFDGYKEAEAGYDFDALLENEKSLLTLSAIFDFLISEESIHNFTCFKGLGYEPGTSITSQDGYGITNWVKYTEYGNTYHDPLSEDDLVDGYSLVNTQSYILTKNNNSLLNFN